MRQVTIRQALQVDALGALLSIMLLAWLLPMASEHLGVAPTVFRYLAVWACGCLLLDLLALRSSDPEHPQGLVRIMIANSTYCLITTALVWSHRTVLTWLGWAYFGAELMVIALIVWWEWGIYRSVVREHTV